MNTANGHKTALEPVGEGDAVEVPEFSAGVRQLARVQLGSEFICGGVAAK
jgi:hypothetical protein